MTAGLLYPRGQGHPILPPVPVTPAPVTPGLKWTTLADIDYTALPNQSLATNGNKTIGGLGYTRTFAAGDAVAMANVLGSGIVIQPIAATGLVGPLNDVPGLYLPLQAAFPTVGVGTPLEISIQQTQAPTTAVYSDSYFGLVTLPTYSASFLVCLTGINSLGLGRRVSRALTGGAAANIESADVNEVAHDCTQLLLPEGMGDCTGWVRCGTYAAGWPTDVAWGNVIRQAPTAAQTVLSGLASAGGVADAAPWAVFIGAARSGSVDALVSTTLRLRVRALL